MTDAEFLFNQTSRERKRNGVGDFHKKRRGGRVIRFPSDNLSRKEREKLDGEPVVYRFRDPIGYKEFKKYPHDIQQEYLDLLADKFHGVTNVLVAESLGVSASTFNVYMFNNKLKLKNHGVKGTRSSLFLKTEDGIAWQKWNKKDVPAEDGAKEEVTEEIEEEAVDEVIEEVNKVIPTENDVAEDTHDVVEENGTVKADSIDSVIAALTALKGNGIKVTKMTIEIVL